MSNAAEVRVNVDEETKRLLKAIAAIRGISLQDAVEGCLTRWSREEAEALSLPVDSLDETPGDA